MPLRAGLARATVERLADADAFSSLGLSRREALWAARALDPAAASEHLPLFENAADPSPEIEAEMRLPTMPPGEEVIILRPVDSTEAMTAAFSKVPFALCDKIAAAIKAKLPQVADVLYDVPLDADSEDESSGSGG